MRNKYIMNLHIFDTDVNIIDRSGAESLIPVQESNEIIQGVITQSAVLQRAQAAKHDIQTVQNAGT